MKYFVNTLIACIALLVGIALVEWTGRWALGTPPQFAYPQIAYERDAALGFRARPNQDSFTFDKHVKTDTLGLRNRENLDRTSKTIVALGDSQTFGTGLVLADSWPSQLQAFLRACCDGHVDVINAGVEGTATWQHAIWMQRVLAAYEPDTVILGVYANDVLPRDGNLTVNLFEPGDEPGRWLYRARSSLVVLAASRVLRRIGRWLQGPSEDTIETDVILDRQNDLVQRGWLEFERSLASMAEQAAQAEVDFQVLLISHRDEIRADVDQGNFARRVQLIAQQINVPVVNPIEELQAHYLIDGEAMFIPWDAHNTAVTNRVLAVAVATQLVGRACPELPD